MLTFLFAVILLAIAALAAIVRKAYFVVEPRELKRQAAHGNHEARELWRAVGYGRSLRVLLWLWVALFGAWGLVILTGVLTPWMAVLFGMLALWLLFSWLPGTQVSATALKLALTVNPAMVWVLQRLDPLLHRAQKPLARHYREQHSGLYELHDLLDLLDLQAAQADNRIAAEQLATIRAVLEFTDLRVRDVVRLHAKTVALTDAIGPILLDELHADGQSVFPVTKTPRSREILGCVFLGDLSIKSEGTIADYASMGVLTLRENAPLHEALDAFLSSKYQLAVVVDKADDTVGILTLKDIMAELVPAPVTAIDAELAETEPAPADDDPATESDETVVE